MKELWLISEAGWQGYLSRMISKQARLSVLESLNPNLRDDRRKMLDILVSSGKLRVGNWDDEEGDGGEGDDEPSPYVVEGAYHYMVELYDNVAVLRISGTLVPDYHWWNRIYDDVSYPEIISCCNYLQGLKDNGQIDTVVLAFDTPGGAVHGIETAANALETLGKSVKLISHAETQMTSGGVWLGVSAKKISANRMAVVASIGVIAVQMSYYRMLEEAGIDATVMRSGSEKALGTPYEKFSDKAKEVMQEGMDIVHQEFKNRVQEGRGMSTADVEKISTGRSWMAFQPEVSKLIDEITTLDAVVAKHIAVHNPRNSAINPIFSVQVIGKEAGTMKVKVLNEKGQAAVAAGLSAEEALKDASMYDVRDAVEEGTKPAATEEGKKPQGDGKPAVTEEGKKTEGEGSKPAVTEEAVSLQQRLDESLKANGRLEAKIETLNERLAEKDQALELAASSAANLEVIALSAINKMEVALGTSTSDASLKGSALVARHTQITEKFNATFSVGSKATVPAGDDLSARSVSDDEFELKRRLTK